MLSSPRQCSVRYRLCENNDIPGVADELPDVFLMFLIEPHLLWTRVVALMASGYND